ncbi:MFS transporter [Bradyrhizobium sp. 197]|nr:MFS transporter [Bradyrhizobium sp. 197]
MLLGAAEAGFFPGFIFYLTLRFPAEYRARIVGYFMAAIPLSTVIGAPISGPLLYLHGGFGLAGWQWLFLIEAITGSCPGRRLVLLSDGPPRRGRLVGARRAGMAQPQAVDRAPQPRSCTRSPRFCSIGA